MGRAVAATAAVAVALAAPSAGADAGRSRAPALAIDAPAVAIGDGSRELEVVVRATPPAAAAAVALVASAGTVGPRRPAGEGAVAFALRVPRVAAELRLALTARARFGRRSLAATASIAIQPPPAESVGRRSTAGPFDLRVPERVRLGRDRAVDLSIAAAGGEPPDVHASTGSVSAWRAGADGRLHATFTPPDALAPQLALIAVASADRSRVDWAAIPLVGIGSVRLRSEPRASVVVRVGGVDFGPVRTDGRGRATLAIEAPPGVTAAQTVATDAAGNTRAGTLPLQPPPFARALVLCPARGRDVVWVVVDGAGAPAARADIRATASVGTLSPPRNEAPGLWRAQLSLPSGVAPGARVAIRGQLAGDPHSAFSCDAPVPVASPTAIRVAARAPRYVAGSGRQLAVDVRLDYPTALPPADVAVDVRAEVGDVEGVRQVAPGHFVATWRLPDRFAGRRRARVVATAPGLAPAEAVVDLVPGAPAHVVARVTRRRLRGDGVAVAQVDVTVTDAYGNPVDGPLPVATARGAVGPFVRRAPGRFAARYRAPVATRAAVDAVHIAVGAAETEVSIQLLPVRRRWSIAAGAGYVANFGKVAGPAAWLGARARLPVWRRRIAVGVAAAAYASDDVRAAADGGDDVRTRVTGLPVMVRAMVEAGGGRMAGYGGVGAGALWTRRELASARAGTVVRTGAHLAASAFAGGEVGVGPGRAFVELGYWLAHVDDGVTAGNPAGLRAVAGYRLDL
ncbi:MAG: hypothetical protein D6689_20390 [Deltaproteobacteria bacterium]|nr:MAG: hypothetical protein D6689_20390 [Deltaproteobacteria bacterium]